MFARGAPAKHGNPEVRKSMRKVCAIRYVYFQLERVSSVSNWAYLYKHMVVEQRGGVVAWRGSCV
eukprot:9473406-Pyramimonas_sp.AAC.1